MIPVVPVPFWFRSGQNQWVISSWNQLVPVRFLFLVPAGPLWLGSLEQECATKSQLPKVEVTLESWCIE